MPFAALPEQLGTVIDILRGEAFASVLGGQGLHVFDAQSLSFTGV
jgi:hypothetical protein